MLIDNVNKFWGNLDNSYEIYKLPDETKYQYLMRLTNYSTADNKTDVEYIKSRILMETSDGVFELFYKLDRADKILSRYKFQENNFVNTDDENFLENLVKDVSMDSSATKERDFSMDLLRPRADISTVDFIDLSSEEMYKRFKSLVSFTTCENGRPVLYKRKNDSFDRLFVYGQSYDGLEVRNSNEDFAKESFKLCRALSGKGLLSEGSVIFNKKFIEETPKSFILDLWGEKVTVYKSSFEYIGSIEKFKLRINESIWTFFTI